MVAVGAVTWALIGLAVAFGAAFAILVSAWLAGRLTIDLGWGRSLHPLGPIESTIEAPPDVVFDVLSSPYLGRAPKALREQLEVLDRGTDLVVAAHHTRLRTHTSTTVESVRFERPDRISFRLLRGVSPHVVEEFVLEEQGGATRFRYSGELAMDFWAVGRLAGRHLVKPAWERVVARHVDEVKAAAEERARGRHAQRSIG